MSGTLTASGLSADTRSEGGQIAPGALPVTTALELPTANTHPGSTVTGTLAVHNTSDTPHTLRLSVADLKSGLLTLTPAEIQVKPGESGTRKITVEVAPATSSATASATADCNSAARSPSWTPPTTTGPWCAPRSRSG